MSERVTEEDARRLLDVAKARLAVVQGQRQDGASFLDGIRLAHAKAMVQAAERLLRRAEAAASAS
jgi:hypothetical protein